MWTKKHIIQKKIIEKI